MLIKLTEITRRNNELKTQPVLVNAESIVMVSNGELPSDGPHIIGLSTVESVRLVGLSNGRGVFIQESIEEIQKLCTTKNNS